MALTDAERLRSLLGEEIPAGGTAGSTLFSDEKVQDMLQSAGGDLALAAVSGWQIKAAHYADLVDVAEGNSSRKMSDLHKNALAMVKYYSGTGEDGTGGTPTVGPRNVVIGEISRRRY